MGATESSQSESSNTSIVDRMFCCPVCYEKYKSESHILQCQLGHVLCEDCHGKINRCPQCSSRFLGTRNYVLEEMISELGRLNCSPEQAVADVRAATDRRRNVNRAPTQAPSPPRASPQTQERTVCRMQNCRLTMPLTGLERHLVDCHSDNVRRLAATNYLSRSHFSFNLYCGNSRYALLTEFGIFFLILRVSKSFLRKVTVTAWIQGACTTVEASLFYSWLQIELGNTRATHHDIVHHSRSTVAQIEERQECLCFGEFVDDTDILKIKGYVCLNRCKEDHPRRSSATVTESLRDYDDYSSD